MPSPDAFLLDTSAFMALVESEPGRDRVRELIEAAIRGEVVLHACFVSLTEVRYIVIYKRGPGTADQTIAELKALPVHWIHSDDALCAMAAEWKANHKVSFADAFVVAAAQRAQAVLVHKDPEFDALAGVTKLHGLPPKAGKTT